ncbi:HNH endonuclease [Aquibacillus sediminis]|uniref:HNH endonuclease n=1 Tax=Aquibacillus sediminis TaxID=2574734 RepID=UPI001109B2A3|nr:HNH endonuclease [Aquibacillus sediminis]
MNFKDQIFELPPLKPNGREREFKYYSDELKAKVIFEHLFNGKTHRWMDKNILDTNGNTNGRNSANILYYLGMKADYRGIFKGLKLSTVIKILEHKGQDYAYAVNLLKFLVEAEIVQTVKSDIEAEMQEEGKAIEGNIKYYYGKRYERDCKNRMLAIKKHGLNCYVCGFNFEEKYGKYGKDFIEVHHIKPLSTLEKAVEINPETDLVPLCANCHRMIHRRKDYILNVDELSEVVKENREKANTSYGCYPK